MTETEQDTADTPCVACKKPIPKGATICHICKTYQNWRSHFAVTATVLGLLVAGSGVLSGVISAVFYLTDRDSHTRFKVTSANNEHLYLKVWNTGRQPSTLIGYRLIFDDLPDKEVMLELMARNKLEARNVIAPGPPVLVGLSKVLPSDVPKPNVATQYTLDERAQILGRKVPLNALPMTLEIDIQESNDPGGHFWTFVVPEQLVAHRYYGKLAAPREFHVRRDRFKADRIGEFVMETIKP